MKPYGLVGATTAPTGLVDLQGRPLGWQAQEAVVGTSTPFGPVVKYNTLPTQHPSRDWVLYAAQYGGPEASLDVRMYLDRRCLAALIDACKGSTTGRCIIGMAGIVVEQYEARTGSRHPWARLVMVGRPPRPEEAVIETAGANSPAKLAAGVEVWTSNPRPEEDATLVQRVVVGGPETQRDHRIFFDNYPVEPKGGGESYRPLSRLLTMANASPTGRVLLGQVGVRERCCRAKSRHTYKYWTFVHRPARVERSG